MKHKQLTVCKANKVVEAGYKLSLNELRVLWGCIGQVNSMQELLKTDEFELSAKDFAKLFVVSEDRAYHALIDVTDSLFNRYVVVDNPYPDKPHINRLKMRWISSIQYLESDGKIVLRFAQEILPFLCQFKGNFTKYKLEHIGKMTCVYGIRLYELLVQWQETGKREIEIDWLKQQFELDENYSRMDNFKARVIDPAIKDINTHSNFNVGWTQRKTGRRVTHFIFTFAEKQPETPKAAAKPKEKIIKGVRESDIVKQAKAGETWEQAAERIKTKRAAKAN